jgi:hypothetical protein
MDVRRRYKASAMASRSVREVRVCGSSDMLDAMLRGIELSIDWSFVFWTSYFLASYEVLIRKTFILWDCSTMHRYYAGGGRT